jgi:hypothetical protein
MQIWESPSAFGSWKDKEQNDSQPLRISKGLHLFHKRTSPVSHITDLHPEEEFSVVVLELQDVNPSRRFCYLMMWRVNQWSIKFNRMQLETSQTWINITQYLLEDSLIRKDDLILWKMESRTYNTTIMLWYEFAGNNGGVSKFKHSRPQKDHTSSNIYDRQSLQTTISSKLRIPLKYCNNLWKS